jgi:hypothetical protein
MSGSKSSVPASDAPVNDPMAMTVHSLPDPAQINDQQRTRAGRWRMLMVVAACAAPVIASYFSFYVLDLRGNAYGELIVPTVDLPSTLKLSNLQGEPVLPDSLKGQWLLTLVQDSSCDASCEKRLFAQRQFREMLGKERDKVDKLLLLPDDAPLRPELATALAQGVPVTVLRAPREQLEAWLKPAQGHALQEHFFLIDPVGRWMLRWQVEPDPSKLKRDLARLIRASGSWDKPGR